MPYAVTHVLLTIIAIDIYRNFVTKHKKYFPLHTVFLGGLAGLLPDIDIPLGWLIGFFGGNVMHGGITHTLLFSLIFLIPAFIFLKKKQHKKAALYFVISFGVFSHVFLDWFLGGGMYEGVMWFWPITSQAFYFHILIRFGADSIPHGIDAILLLGWLFYEERKHKIKDFI